MRLQRRLAMLAILQLVAMTIKLRSKRLARKKKAFIIPSQMAA